MIEFGDDIREVFLQPGGFYFGGGRTRISTLLGSCISITLWHPARRIGGMCHFMLPTRGQPADYQVKVFGGGNMLTHPGNGAEPMNIATRNVDSAYALLARHGYRPTVAHCGGQGHRKLFFDLWTGHVWLAHRPPGEAA